jgi:hypothetical protein
MRPAGDIIENTVPDTSAGTYLILQKARAASINAPLVVFMGGQGTCPVSAYLMDTTIANKMILVWDAGNSGNNAFNENYNGAIDSWSACIALKKLRMVIIRFTCGGSARTCEIPAAYIPNDSLDHLVDTPLRWYMKLVNTSLCSDGIGSQGAVDCATSTVFGDTTVVTSIQNVSFDYYGGQTAYWKNDNSGKSMVITGWNNVKIQKEWMRAVRAKATVAANSPTPFGGTAWEIPGKIEAENYDEGYEGAAYHDADASNPYQRFGHYYRGGDGVDCDALTNCSNQYHVANINAGEWLGYTINVGRSGLDTVKIRVASTNSNKKFHLEFGPVGRIGGAGVTSTGSLTVPNTGSWTSYTTVASTVSLNAGTQWMRFVAETDGFNIDYFQIVAGSSITSVLFEAAPSPARAKLEELFSSQRVNVFTVQGMFLGAWTMKAISAKDSPAHCAGVHVVNIAAGGRSTARHLVIERAGSPVPR